MWDVIIVGAGPAGLSAALLLGRCRRRVLVCHGGPPRNAASHGLHGFLSRDGIEPRELLRIARDQLAPYSSVTVRHIEVTGVTRGKRHFEVSLAGGERVESRFLLLATGVVDELPPIDGLRDLYGRSVHHCPYCDGWEWRDQPIAAYGRGKPGLELALLLTVWSPDVVLCSDGPAELDDEGRKRLAYHRISVREERIIRLEGQGAWLSRIVFRGAEPIERRALFLHLGSPQRSKLASDLGCTFSADGGIETNHARLTCVPGLYVAGDALKEVQLAIDAAADGARAAMGINAALLQEDLARAEGREPQRVRSS